jgi:Tol biopolymer transport system component
MHRRTIVSIFLPFLLCTLSAIGILEAGPKKGPVDLKRKALHNETAYIPSQCYTKTQIDGQPVQNPCYVCHTRSVEPNYINDWDLQLTYRFPENNLSNPWENLFEDRTGRIAGISDQAILEYIRQDNYHTPDGAIRPAERLNDLPESWDYNGNGRWDGYVPDCFFNIDAEGFDRNPQGQPTGWRAFAYYPFPGTFWPTNGATDDVLIRLPESFRTTVDGTYDPVVYKVNLAIVEALAKGRDVVIAPVDERQVDIDLDRDGTLASARKVVFDWAPLEGRDMTYAGKAGERQRQGKLHLAMGLFPEGTEFLHSVRYVDVTDDGGIALSPRMKELRYMRKRTWQTYADLEEAALGEMKEKDDFPSRTSQFIGNVEQGVNNGTGWLLQGFIEDADGELRPQNFEETTFCIGCHGGVGINTDSVFSMPRKLDGQAYQEGWYHWSQKGLSGIHEPKIEIRGGGVFYEYTYYLMYNHSGNEFRDNDEVKAKFFSPDGALKPEMADRLHEDIAVLLHPSRERALKLNKAYRTIVEDQDFILGRDPNVTPVGTVHDRVEADQPTGLTTASSIDRFDGRFGAGEGCAAAPDVEAMQGTPIAEAVIGNGMDGPDGLRYGVDWQGEIATSRYQKTDIEGVAFTFPPRLTLPTRVIVPIGNMAPCYACHRLPYPNVPEDNRITSPMPSSGSEIASPGLTRLTRSTGTDQGGVWRPDGQEIAFVSDRGGSHQIWLMAADGSGQRQLTRGPFVHGWPVWHPDGKSIACWGYDPSSAVHAVKIVQADGSGERVLAESQEHLDRPAWHPEGDRVAYAALHQGNWDLWVAPVNGGPTVRLTEDPQMETNPLWSPDGKTLAYKVAPIGEYNLTRQFFMTFENGFDNPTVHTWNGPESIQMNAWSPDGRDIAYTAEIISDASGVDRVSYAAMVSDVRLEAKVAKALATLPLANGCTLGDRGPVFSPDGRRVAFWAWDRTYHASLWLYDRKTDDTRQLTRGGMDLYPQWSPDGRYLLFESSRSGSMDLWVLDGEGL